VKTKQKDTQKSNRKPSPHGQKSKACSYERQYLQLKSSDVPEKTRTQKKGNSSSHRENRLFSSQPINHKLQLITDNLLKQLDIDYAAIWMTEPTDLRIKRDPPAKKTKGKPCAPKRGYLHLIASSGSLPHVDEESYRKIPADQGIIAKVISRKTQKYHIRTIDHQSLSRSDRWIQQAGIVSFTGYQLRGEGNRPTGVLAVFGQQPLTPKEESLLEIAVAATHHILLSDVLLHELVEAKELYTSLFNRSLFWVYIHDFDGQLVAGNTTMLDELGFTEEDIPHININNLIPDKTQLQQAQHLIEEVIRYGHTKKPFELKISSKNGSEFWVEGDSALIYREGKPYATHGIARNITQQKKTELLLQQSEERFRRFFECSPDYCYMISPKGNIIDINKSALEIHGKKKEQVVGKQIIPIVFPKSSLSKVEKLIDQWMQKATVKNEEITIKTRTDEERTVLLSADEVKDDKGGALYYILVQKDITERKKQQEELAKSYDLLLRIIDNLLVGMVIIDPESHKIIDANPLALELLETTREALIGTSCHSYFCLDKLGSCPITDHGKNVDVSECRLRTTAGKNLILLKKVTSLQFLEKTYLIESFIDITESKRSLEKLKNLTNETENILNAAADGLRIISSDFKVTSLNKTMAEMTGICPEDGIGMKCHEMFNAPDICGTDKCSLKRVLATGKNFTRQGTWKTPTGKTIHCLNVVTPLRSSSGEIIGVIEDFRDITTIKKVEEDLKVERQQLLSIFDSINESIYVADPHTYEILYANTCLKERYKDNLVGKTCYKALYNYEKPCDHCTNKIILEKRGEPYTWEFHNPTTNRDYDVTNRIIQWPDGKDVRFELASDITKKKMALKELEEAHDLLFAVNKELERKVEDRTAEIARLIEQKDEFINQLGHDLKTPLTPMMALLPQLKESHSKPEELDKILDILVRNVYYMKELVNNTIELAKLNSRRTEFCMEDMQLSSEVENIIHTNKFLFDRNNITVKNNVPSTIVVNADRLRLKEILNNLLTNAVKYSADDGGIVTVDASEKNNKVTVTIKDKGIGMTPDQIDHVFDEFYKADESRSDLDSHGLGLTICKRIVEKHGGAIWAKSQGPGKGTTMCFTLPKGKDQKITVALKN
jgi:PAS domain S-box-containing protein